MNWLRTNRSGEDGARSYATAEDFRHVFAEDLDGLYQLAFLLTGDHEKAEHCFVTGIDDCFKPNRVFREWANSKAERAVIENAIRLVQPRPAEGDFSIVPVPTDRGAPAKDGHFDCSDVLALDVFERFVFVLSVLEQYSEADCAALLCSSIAEIHKTRARALEQIVSRHGRYL